MALVTGGTRGIGLAIARGLGEHGARVVVSSRREESVAATAEELRGAGLQAVGIPAHMGEPEQIGSLVSEVLGACGGVDILVNNAATNPVFGPIAETDNRAFDKIMAVNLRGPLELSRKLHPVMAGRGGGSIVNVSSITGLMPEPGLGLYSVSKAALISLTKVLAREWGPAGIRVNAICPGLIRTEFSTALWQDEARAGSFRARTPLGRIGAPEDLVGIAVYLASPASSYCTGAVFTVDGGTTV